MQQLIIRFAVFCSILVVVISGAQESFAQEKTVRTVVGTVVDERSRPIPNAAVRVTSERGVSTSCQSGDDGRFICVFDLRDPVKIEIVAEGFAGLTVPVEVEPESSDERIFMLTPAGVRENVVVSANRIRSRIGDTPASVTVLGREQVSSSAGTTVDDTLRQAVGFSIFRRSGSRTANPTTQGVSLRGVGSSGASRTLVLDDGTPLNDPFGGWVQWGRVPPIGVERLEVLRGGASSLYGDSSLSGAISVIPRTATANRVFALEIFGGSQGTSSASIFAGFRRRAWAADLTAANFQTKGYIPVDAAQRGPVDAFSGSRNSLLKARFTRDLKGFGDLFVTPSYFGEVRTNGTGMQTNRTHIRQLVSGGRYERSRQRTKAVWRIYGGTQVYDQVFSAVNSTRTIEDLTRVQRSPAQNFGFSGQISTFFGDHTLVAGIDGRSVRGASDEIGFSGGRATVRTGTGGRERIIGAFVQDALKIGDKAALVGNLRVDGWRNSRGYANTVTLSNGVRTSATFPERESNLLSPQIAFLYRANSLLSFHASASRSFRFPTLNELYRGFRVGNVLTLANENLRAERADNLEAGGSVARGRTYARISGFWSATGDAVANITVNTTPTLITRQRQNAGRTRSRGFEVEAETSFRAFSVSAGYQFADSRITRFPFSPALVGLFVPQVARHQLTFQTRASFAKWTFAVQGRAASSQFDDDLNQFRLEPYLQADVFVSRDLRENLRLFAAIENVLNSRYSVGKTPVRTLASPAAVRVGLRWN